MFGFKPYSASRQDEIQGIMEMIGIHLHQLEAQKDVIDGEVYDVTVFLLFELLDIFSSISSLKPEIHFRSCLVLARGIFEDCINLEYIYKKNNERRAKNYRLFSVVEYLNRAEKFQDDIVQKDELINRLRAEVKMYAPSGADKRIWDGISLAKKAEETGREQTYDFFRQTSNYSHAKFRGNIDFSEKRPYLDFLRELVYRITILETMAILQLIAERFDLDGGVIYLTNPEFNKDIIWATNPKKFGPIDMPVRPWWKWW